jgi:hypothetical protein
MGFIEGEGRRRKRKEDGGRGRVKRGEEGGRGRKREDR